MKLRVLQFDSLVGYLESTADRGVIFRYAPEHLGKPQARPLSVSLPLRESPYSQASTMPFFAGLLPDGEVRKRIADSLHISEASTLKLLAALGGECAGTVSILRDSQDNAPDEGQSEGEPIAAGYREIPDSELERMILESEQRPLMLPREGARLSLAGAQEKLPLMRQSGRWYRPIGGAPSTHIIKPASSRFPEIVVNEFICMRFAAALGLEVSGVELANIGKPVLIVARYDRVVASDGIVSRIHQEDFCQALKIMPDKKYQADGGPGFQDIAKLIRRASTAPLKDLERIIDIALFNVLAGNCDAHGKNFSLLYRDERIGLAPFYDLVSTTFWPQLDTKLSMRFGKEYQLERITRESLKTFASDIGVKPILVEERLNAIFSKAPSAWEQIKALSELTDSALILDQIMEGWKQRTSILTKQANSFFQ